MKKLSTILLTSFLALFLTVGSAMAAVILDFNVISPAAGTVSFSGGDAPLIGTGISVNNVVGLNTPANSMKTLVLSSGVLEFTTGSHIGDWQWGGGMSSTITLTGGIADLGLSDDTVLLSGYFDFAQVVPLTPSIFKVAVTGFFDTKDPTLVGFYGLPAFQGDGKTPFPYYGNLNLSFVLQDGTGAPDAFSSIMVLSGDIANTPVPVPPTLLLFGSGLAGLVGLGRRKFFKKG